MRIALILLAVGMAGASCLVAQVPNDFQYDFDVAVSRVAAAYAYRVRDTRDREDCPRQWPDSSFRVRDLPRTRAVGIAKQLTSSAFAAGARTVERVALVVEFLQTGL